MVTFSNGSGENNFQNLRLIDEKTSDLSLIMLQVADVVVHITALQLLPWA